MIKCIPFIFFVFISSCVPSSKKTSNVVEEYIISKDEVQFSTVTFEDTSRRRLIPLAFYSPIKKSRDGLPIVIFSHGYGQNKGGDYFEYSYLTNFIASQGYFVASIQHELPTDELLSMSGNLYETRMPNWERGAQNILYVINRLKEIAPSLDYKNITLVGHSNGGDMSVLFAQKYPGLIKKYITLDHRRMPVPRSKKPKFYSLRSSDQVADKDVLPTLDEQLTYQMKIIQLTDVAHNDMNDQASESQRIQINRQIQQFLAE